MKSWNLLFFCILAFSALSYGEFISIVLTLASSLLSMLSYFVYWTIFLCPVRVVLHLFSQERQPPASRLLVWQEDVDSKRSCLIILSEVQVVLPSLNFFSIQIFSSVPCPQFSLPGAEKKDRGMRYTRHTRRTRHGTVAEKVEMQWNFIKYWHVRYFSPSRKPEVRGG